MKGMKNSNIDGRIRRKIRVPQHLPIDMNREKYIQSAINMVHKEMQRGKSLNDAVNTVNDLHYRRYDKSSSPVKGGVRSLSFTPIQITVVGIISILLVAMGYGIFALTKYEKNMSNISSINDMSNIQPIDSDQMILVSGVDTRPSTDIGYGNNTDVPGSRTDTIAIVYVPKETQQVTIVSIPRDLSVDIDNCKQWDSTSRKYSPNTITASGEKINASYSNGGPQCLLDTVNKTFGLSIDKYAEVDFNVFKDIVDEVGGVEVSTDQPIVDDTLGTIIAQPGSVRLNGEQALNYVRARKVEGTSKSDLDRIQRQHKFFLSLFSNISDSGKSHDPLFMMSMANTLSSKMNTINLSIVDIASLIKSAGAVPVENFVVTTIPIVGDDEYGNLIYDDAKTEDLFRTIQENNTLVSPDGSHGNFYEPVSLKDSSVTIITKNPYDSRIKTVKNAVSPHVRTVNNTVSDISPEKTTAYFSGKDYGKMVSVASMFPNIYISTNEPPIDTHSDIVIVLSSDADNVFRTMSEKTDYEQKHFIPYEFNGNGFEIVPRTVSGS